MRYRLSLYYAKTDDSGIFTCTAPTGHDNYLHILVKGVYLPLQQPLDLHLEHRTRHPPPHPRQRWVPTPLAPPDLHLSTEHDSYLQILIKGGYLQLQHPLNYPFNTRHDNYIYIVIKSGYRPSLRFLICRLITDLDNVSKGG